jgi:hypothetical protein
MYRMEIRVDKPMAKETGTRKIMRPMNDAVNTRDAIEIPFQPSLWLPIRFFCLAFQEPVGLLPNQIGRHDEGQHGSNQNGLDGITIFYRKKRMFHHAGYGVKMKRFPNEDEQEKEYGPTGEPFDHISDPGGKPLEEIFHDHILTPLENDDKT